MRILLFIPLALLLLAVLWLINYAMTIRLRRDLSEARREVKTVKQQRDARDRLLDLVLEEARSRIDIDPHTAPVIIETINNRRGALDQ
jgi:hypothetical protein